MRWLPVVLVAACGGAPAPVAPKPVAPAVHDPHRAAVTAQIQPLIDHGILSSVVVGIYDAGDLEVYGFGQGPHGAPPDASTLFEIGSVSKVYTSLLLADAIQRREVSLATPVSELLPPGVTMPTRGDSAITLGHLALHVSGLPRLPPSIAARPTAVDPYGGYDENALYADLVHTGLDFAPGQKVVYSNYGAGLLGFVLGRKLGGGYAKALATRVLGPLGLGDTFVIVPSQLSARRATGTDSDLHPTPPWTFDALAGAGAIVSTAHDQLELVEDELDAYAGGKLAVRAAMRLTQEPRLLSTGDNAGLGWQIDRDGRYWHNGGTGGFHSFVGFDPKTRRGIVVLAATSTSLVDRLADTLYKVLAGDKPAPPVFPTAAQLAPLVGKYELSGDQVEVIAEGDRLFLAGTKGRVRLVPFSDHEFWIEALQGVAAFERSGALVLVIHGVRVSAARVPADKPTDKAPAKE